MSITLKSKIRYNGQEYSSPADLPPDIRRAYEKALHEGTRVTKRFVVNGQSFANEDEMPADVRRLCDDAMSVIENNGEVTLPNASDENRDFLLTKKEWGIAIAVGVGITALVLTRVFHG